MTVYKYIRLYFSIVKVSVESQLSYRCDFILQLIIWTIYSFVNFIGLYLLMINYVEIGSQNFIETIYMFGLITISYNLARMIARSFDNFHVLTMTGDLDVFYIRPLPIIFQIISSNLFLRRIAGIFQGIVVLIIYYQYVNTPIYNFAFITSLIILNTTIMYVGLLICYGALCFVSENGNLFLNLFVDTSSNIGYYPLKYLTGIVKYFLIIVIPIYYVVYIPATLLISADRGICFSIFISSVISMIILGLSVIIFNRMSKKYQSVNS
ncbi:ABC-2 family transporter protein [Anaerorhabdus sp.]|uniref:ABC-2 family transporter protein n=1 Tax=Anaerorhabdus sp. TaxID=1872524 RepID=UPI002FCBAE29